MRGRYVRPAAFCVLLAACQPAAAPRPWPWWQGPDPNAEPTGTRWYAPKPAAPKPGPAATAHEVEPATRRYRGVVGADSVTMVLNSWLSGEYYTHRSGKSLDLTGKELRSGAGHDSRRRSWWLTEYEDDAPYTGSHAQLDVTGHPGRELVGEWCWPGRPARPVRLRASYWGAAPLRIETWHVRGRQSDLLGTYPEADDSIYFSADYLTLPARHPAAAGVRQLLGPPRAPAAMPRYLDSLLRQDDYNRRGTSHWLSVDYNDDFLLSVSRYTDIGCAECELQELVDGLTVDLRTGRRLALADVLRPGAEARLLRLLRRRVADDTGWEAETFTQLPTGGFCVVPTGLRFTYDRRDVADLCCTGSGQTNHTLGTTLSFAELRPLLRPGSPLTRVLRQRGLAAAAQPRRRLRR